MSAAVHAIERVEAAAAEFERGTLGVLIRAPELLGADLCGVGAVDFSTWHHRMVFDAARAVSARGAIDVYLVADELQRRDQLDIIGGMQFLAELGDAAPFSESLARTYAKKVRAAADNRRLIVAAADAAAIHTERGAEPAAQFARATLEELAKRASVDQLAGIRTALVADLEAGPAAIDAATPPRWISYPRLPVAGACLAAPGSTGKTTLVLGEMVRIAAGLDLYGDDVDRPGTCVYVSAEDGATYPRYLLQRILADGADALSERAVAAAKHGVRIIGWSRSKYGPLMTADESGETRICAVWPLLLELIAPLEPAYVTFDPSVLFGPGERHGNDAAAAFAALMHESAQQIGALVQTIDHVAQSVARGGIVDQYASRGGTGKVDESRLARQLVRVNEQSEDPLPLMVTPRDVAEGRVLVLHWTKPSYAPRPPPVWLRRRGHWFEHLRAPSADDVAAEREREHTEQAHDDAAIVAQYVHAQLGIGAGIRMTQRDIEGAGITRSDGTRITRDRARAAVQRALAVGALRHEPLPASEVRGARKSYLVPADYCAANVIGPSAQ